jgi:hypothetical protein
MLRHIDHRPAIFTAERQTLEHAQRYQQDRGDPTDLVIAGQQSHQESRNAHDHDGDQEGVFAPRQIA